MFAIILGWIMKSKIAKVGGGALCGSGLIALLLGFADAREVSLKQYVDLKDQVIIEKIVPVKEDIVEIKNSIIRIENYIINKPKNGGK